MPMFPEIRYISVRSYSQFKLYLAATLRSTDGSASTRTTRSATTMKRQTISRTPRRRRQRRGLRGSFDDVGTGSVEAAIGGAVSLMVCLPKASCWQRGWLAPAQHDAPCWGRAGHNLWVHDFVSSANRRRARERRGRRPRDKSDSPPAAARRAARDSAAPLRLPPATRRDAQLHPRKSSAPLRAPA